MLCIAVPQVVANQSWVGRTAGLPTTTIYTPASAGLFRVTGYAEAASGNDDSVTASLEWTDDHTNQLATLAEVNTAGKWMINSPQQLTFRAAASSNITLSTFFSGSCTYDLYIVVEQLL